MFIAIMQQQSAIFTSNLVAII